MNLQLLSQSWSKHAILAAALPVVHSGPPQAGLNEGFPQPSPPSMSPSSAALSPAWWGTVLRCQALPEERERWRFIPPPVLLRLGIETARGGGEDQVNLDSLSHLCVPSLPPPLPRAARSTMGLGNSCFNPSSKDEVLLPSLTPAGLATAAPPPTNTHVFP